MGGHDCLLHTDKYPAIGAVDGLYYMSSPNVVFVCKAGRMFFTVNKPLVPEWPCIIEVSYIYSSYTAGVAVPACFHPGSRIRLLSIPDAGSEFFPS